MGLRASLGGSAGRSQKLGRLRLRGPCGAHDEFLARRNRPEFAEARLAPTRSASSSPTSVRQTAQKEPNKPLKAPGHTGHAWDKSENVRRC